MLKEKLLKFTVSIDQQTFQQTVKNLKNRVFPPIILPYRAEFAKRETLRNGIEE